MSELEDALSSTEMELLEDYREDPRGHSHLVLGFTRAKQPIHAVCAVHEGVLVIITVYRPDPRVWQHYRIHKERR